MLLIRNIVSVTDTVEKTTFAMVYTSPKICKPRYVF